MKYLLCYLTGKFVEMLKSVDGKVPAAITTHAFPGERPLWSAKTWPGEGRKGKTNLGNHFPNTADWPRDPLETQVGNRHPCCIIHNPLSQDAYSWEIQTSITEIKMPLLRGTQLPSSSLITPHCREEHAYFRDGSFRDMSKSSWRRGCTTAGNTYRKLLFHQVLANHSSKPVTVYNLLISVLCLLDTFIRLFENLAEDWSGCRGENKLSLPK